MISMYSINVHRDTRVGFDNTLVIFPISPKRALLLDNEKIQDTIVEVQDDLVIEFNRLVMNHARECVFASIESEMIRRAFDETEKASGRFNGASLSLPP